MKRRLLIVLFLALVPALMRGQSVPFIEQDKTWHVRVYNDVCDEEETFCFTAESDTVIKDVHYMRMFEVTGNKLKTVGIFREEGSVVYIYYPQWEKEEVCYDFTLNTAEEISILCPSPTAVYQCKVTNTSTRTLLDGTAAREIHFSATPEYIDWDDTYTDYDETDNVWIEGIGNVIHPLINIDDCNLDRGLTIILTSVQRGKETIYRNTTSAISAPKSSEKNGHIYDIQGRPVTKDTQHGLFISNGRKYFAK